MKIFEIYSMVCKIFALNFALAPNQILLNELRKNPKWILQNQSEANLKGNELYLNALNNENFSIISADFDNLKKYFNVIFFFENEGEILTKFYAKCGFEPNLSTSTIASATNEFSFLAAFFALEPSKENNKIIFLFLGVHLLPLAQKLAKILQNEAKSDYYRAFGYFLSDFSEILQKSLKIEATQR